MTCARCSERAVRLFLFRDKYGLDQVALCQKHIDIERPGRDPDIIDDWWLDEV